ncbi:MAG: hypothetical protein WC389_04320 [Lutibacter sp.]|jgi:hypothetical protein
MKFLKITVLFLIGFCLQSCTKDVDFDQLDQASVQSIYVVTLVYLDLTAPNFLDNFNNEISLSTDVINVPITKDAEPYVEKVEITVITQNTFNRAFTFNFVFYDSFNTPIYTLQPTIMVPENSGETTTIIEIPKSDLSIIYNTVSIGAYINLLRSGDGSVLTKNEIGTLNLKSSSKRFLTYLIK